MDFPMSRVTPVGHINAQSKEQIPGWSQREILEAVSVF